MKAKSIVILLVLAVALFSPLSITFPGAGGGTTLASMDICDAAHASCVSTVSSATAIHESPFDILRAEFVGVIEVMPPVVHLPLIASQEEPPPQS